MTLKVFCSLCVIKVVFLRGLYGNDIYVLKFVFTYVYIHTSPFSRRDFRWPDSILTTIPGHMLNPPFRRYTQIIQLLLFMKFLFFFIEHQLRDKGI